MNRTDNIITLSDGRKLCYAEYGDPKGKPLFYLHGWPSSRLRSKINDDQAKSLHVRIISSDRPGYGRSDYKEDRTILGYIDDIVELADSLGIKKFSVVGVSGGGPYAAACAYRISKRIKKMGIVVGLAPTYIPGIFKGMPFLYRFGWENYSRYPILAKLGAIYRWLTTGYLDKVLFRFDFRGGNDQEVLNKLKDEWVKIGRESFRQGYKGAEKDLLLYTSDWGFKLEDIKVPTLLFYGEEDKNVTLAMARYYKSQIPGSKLKIYPNEGHLISITHAKEIFKTLTS